MADIETVINGLNDIGGFIAGRVGFEQARNFLRTIDDACDLLKEQEAVEPEVEVLNEIDRLYRCPKCHKHFFYKKQKYCDQCGRSVKWECLI